MHNAAFRALELDWVYAAFPVPPGRLRDGIARLLTLGVAGVNVTMPHKEEAALVADRLSDEASKLRAVNTLVRAGDGFVGHNTDAPGFRRFLESDAGYDASGRTALLVGAGGAARACALVLADMGARRLVVAVRDPDRASALVQVLEGRPVIVETVALARADLLLREVDLVVNATPAGQAGEDLPLHDLGPGHTLVDLVYRPPATPLQERARRAGARAYGGLGMLLHQGAISFELWTGRFPPLGVMSAAALSDLAR